MNKVRWNLDWKCSRNHRWESKSSSCIERIKSALKQGIGPYDFGERKTIQETISSTNMTGEIIIQVWNSFYSK